MNGVVPYAGEPRTSCPSALVAVLGVQGALVVALVRVGVAWPGAVEAVLCLLLADLAVLVVAGTRAGAIGLALLRYLIGDSGNAVRS